MDSIFFICPKGPSVVLCYGAYILELIATLLSNPRGIFISILKKLLSIHMITQCFNSVLRSFTETCLLKMRFLTTPSKPQQLSTYALTLFNYKTEVNGVKVAVGTSNLYSQLLYIIYMGIADYNSKYNVV